MTYKKCKKHRIRIVHLQLLPLLTGVQRVSLDELTRLDVEKFEPWIICKQPGPFSNAAERAGISCLYVSCLVRPINPMRDICALFSLLKLFRKYRFDIVHTHSSKTGILGRLAARLAGVSVVLHTVHGFSFPHASSKLLRLFYYLIEYAGSKLDDTLIVLNESDKNVAKNILSVNTKKLFLLPNGIDVDNFTSSSMSTRNSVRNNIYGVKNDDVVVGMVGRLWRQKNPECFLRAALNIIKTDSKSHFFFIGDGELSSKLEDMISKNNACDRIHMLGWRDDVPLLLTGLDVFVLPSRWEGMPLSILEAMAASLPVIVSDISGNKDMIDDGIDGFVFDDDRKLIQLILKLIDDKILRQKLGERARRKVEEQYLLMDRVRKIEGLYLSLLDVHATP